MKPNQVEQLRRILVSYVEDNPSESQQVDVLRQVLLPVLEQHLHAHEYLITVRHPHAGPGAPFYTLKLKESDTSQLYYDPKHGTGLDKSLPKKYEYVMHERDDTGYMGHAGNFAAGVETWPKALEYLFGLADMSLTNPPTNKPKRK